MTCGQRIRLKEFPPPLERELARLNTLWNDGLSRFGGPFLAGQGFTAVDAFFAPVAFRVASYGLTLDTAAAAYVARLLALSPMKEWRAAALAETFRDESHELDILSLGEVVEDLRATPTPA